MEQTHDSDSTLSPKIKEQNISRSSNRSKKTFSVKKTKSNINNGKKSFINSDSDATNSDIGETSNKKLKKIKERKLSDKLNHKSLFEFDKNDSSSEDDEDFDDNNSQDLLMNADLQENEGNFSVVPGTQDYEDEKSNTSIEDISVPDTPEKEISEVENGDVDDTVDESVVKDANLTAEFKSSMLCDEDDNHTDRNISLSDTFDNSILNKVIDETINQMNGSLVNKKDTKQQKKKSVQVSFEEDFNDDDDVDRNGELDKNIVPTQLFTSKRSNNTLDKTAVNNSKNDSDNNNLLTQFFSNDNSPIGKTKRKSDDEAETDDLVNGITEDRLSEKDEANKSTKSKNVSTNLEATIGEQATNNTHNEQEDESKGDVFENEDVSLKVNETKTELNDSVFKSSYKKRPKKSLGLSTSTPLSKATPNSFSSSICSKSAFKIPEMKVESSLKYNKGMVSANTSFVDDSSGEKKASKRSMQCDIEEGSVEKVVKINIKEASIDSRNSSGNKSGKKRLTSLESRKKRLLSQNEWDQFEVKNQPSQEEKQFISQFKDSLTKDESFTNNGVQDILPNAFSNVTSRKSVKNPAGKSIKTKVSEICSSDEEIAYDGPLKRKSYTKGKRLSTTKVKEDDAKRSKSDSGVEGKEFKSKTQESFKNLEKSQENIEEIQEESKINTSQKKNDRDTSINKEDGLNGGVDDDTKKEETKSKKPKINRKSHVSKKESNKENNFEKNDKNQSNALDSSFVSIKKERSIQKKKSKSVKPEHVKNADKEADKNKDAENIKEQVFNNNINNKNSNNNGLNETFVNDEDTKLNKTLKNDNDVIEPNKNENKLEVKKSKRATKGKIKSNKVKDTTAIEASKEENDTEDDVKDNDKKEITKKTAKGRRKKKVDTDAETGLKQTSGNNNDIDSTLASESSIVSRNNTTMRGRKKHYKILFTGLDKDEGMKIVKKLGGMVVEVVKGCTHIITTDSLKRTIKLLCGVAMGIPVVRLQWLRDSMQSHEFIDHTGYLLKDAPNEEKYGFVLEESLQKAVQSPLYSGLCFHITKNVKVSDLDEVIRAANGKVLKTQPTKRHLTSLYVISCPEDLSFCTALSLKLEAELKVVTCEFVLTGVLRQELPYEEFKLESGTTAETTNHGFDVSMISGASTATVDKASKKIKGATVKMSDSIVSDKNTKKKSRSGTTGKNKKHDVTLNEDEKERNDEKDLIKKKAKLKDEIKQNEKNKNVSKSRVLSACDDSVENIENAKPRRKNIKKR